MAAISFTFFMYGADRIFGDAFTLFSTVPLIPMLAFALAYSLMRAASMALGLSPSRSQKMLRPAYPL
jgi:hypothetical protein